jgi:transposase InsO family protein
VDFDDLDERRRAIALFRYAIIAELDLEDLPRGELSVRIAALAVCVFHTPSGKECRFTVRTLWSWWSAYKREGLLGLVPKARLDRGVSRVIDRALLEAAIAVRSELPSRSTSTLVDILEKKGLVPKGKLRRATLDRHLAEAGASRRRLKTLGDKRYIRMLFERPNQFWVGDYHEAPLLFDPKTERYRTVHICAFIDHYSKLVPHAEWYRTEQIATLEDTLKKALLKRGIPGNIYVDNGSAYRSADFAFALAHPDLKIKQRHSKAYAKEGRGVIERWNRTLADQFEPEARHARIEELGRLNVLFEAWLEQRYHLTMHEATGQPPLDRFAADGFAPRFPDPVAIQDIFRVRVKRKVHPKTSTVEVDGIAFVVETFLRGRWVGVHYDPHRLDDVLVFSRRKRIQRALPQKPNEPPLPRPETPRASPMTFDYLGALRAEYDRRLVAEAKKLSLSDWTPTDGFSRPAFLELCAAMLGKDLSAYERDAFVLAWNTVGPFSEKTARLALEHALKLRGRGLHVSVYSHYLKVFHLEAIKALRSEGDKEK